MKIYALQHGDSLFSTTFYSTKKLVRKALKKKRDEIMCRNVHVTCDEQDKFSFYFGWEESGATWRVREITVLEEE